MKRVRCPKCDGVPSVIMEISNGHTITYDCDEKGVAEEEGYLNAGNHSHSEAICSKCSYQWRLRKIGYAGETRSK